MQNEFDCVGYVFSGVTLTNLTLSVPSDVFALYSNSPVLVENFSATNINDATFVFYYNCPNITISGDFNYQESNVPLFGCASNSTLYFNSVFDLIESNYIGDALDCTLVIAGVDVSPIVVDSSDVVSSEKTSGTGVGANATWIILGSCILAVLIVLLIAASVIFYRFFRTKNYTEI